MMEEKKHEDWEDTYLHRKDIVLRSYQAKLIEKAKVQNSIIFLPTGAGKTLIAVSVLCSRGQDIRGTCSDNWKKAFFVAPTKVMVQQITTVLLARTKFKVGYYTGDMDLDSWSKSMWDIEFQKYEVFVLTAEILRNILVLKYIPPRRISIIVFDECHHAVLNHPYSGVMQALKHFEEEEQPLILGLTATLVNSTPKKPVADILAALENTLNAKILTEVETYKVMKFVADPEMRILEYDAMDMTSLTAVLKVYEEAIQELGNAFALSPKSNLNFKEDVKAEKNLTRSSSIRKWLTNARVHLEELGVYGGSVAALYYIILLEKQRLLCENNLENQALICSRTQLNKVRRLLAKIMGNDETAIYKYSSPKVHKLLDIIVETYNSSKGDSVSTIVFVKRRITAVILASILNSLKTFDERFNKTKTDFVVSTSVINANFRSPRWNNEKIVKRFSARELNLLFATNILEEGIDISACNVIISFDFPNGYSSFVQSRGRGRDKASLYYVFHASNEPKKKEELEMYIKTEKEIIQVVCKNIENDEEEMDEGSQSPSKGEEETLCLLNPIGGELRIDGSTAIKVVYRYCSHLPQDRFACLEPIVWYKKDGPCRRAYLELPMASNVRNVIEGGRKANIKLAKKSVFLRAVKSLWNAGELDSSLSLKNVKINFTDFKELFPHYKNIKIDKSLPQPGTSKRKQVYNTSCPALLTDCLPVPDGKTYLHVIEFSVEFSKPDLDRKATLYDLLKSPCTYGLLTSRKLSKICDFPLFLDMGQINCKFLVNFRELVLSSKELVAIKLFHFSLFEKVLNIPKESQTFDDNSKEFSYFVVPLRKTGEAFDLNWDVIQSDYCKENSSTVVPYNPSSENARRNERETSLKEVSNNCKSLVPSGVFDGRLMWGASEANLNFILTEAMYSNFVISPNYRSVMQYYVVSSFCHNMSPLSSFPREEFADFFQYYKEKYDIHISNLDQPLLKVSILPNCSNYNRPRYEEKGVSRKYRTRAKEYVEIFVPELCYVHPFFKTYWMKAVFVPTVLNRISNLYRAQELRDRIATDTGLGAGTVDDETVSWEPLQVEKWKVQDEFGGGDAFAVDVNKKKSKLELPLSRLKSEGRERKRTSSWDPERNLNEICLCDLEEYIESFKTVDEEEEYHEIQSLRKNEEDIRASLLKFVEVKELKMFSKNVNSFGPQLADILQACTSKFAHDIMDYERLEILGDSFLKFATSLFLFKKYSLLNEGILTSIKGKLIGNRNLLDCATAKNLAAFINAYDFSPMSDWTPPLFSTPEPLLKEIITGNIDPVILHKFVIPQGEKLSGQLSEETLKKNKEIVRCEGSKSIDPVSDPLVGRQPISDKTIADVVEALIGLYLSNFGLEGGFRIMNWFDLLPKNSGSFSEIMEKPFEFHILNGHSNKVVESHLKEVFVDDLESLLNYKFNNKGLLLEALTHPSYATNRCTLCYQRLEFLGDAILDFLITTYLYENFSNLNPGQVTDIRSALVNNITFACLTVRYGLHKYLLLMSSTLTKYIEAFVKLQLQRDYRVDDNILLHLEEENCLLAESITVPKALGDLFESIAGAIFIDSNNSLETVWRVYYPLMRREIEEFTKSPPKSVLRHLYEICQEKPYFETTHHEGHVTVMCVVLYKDHEITCYGYGKNKQEGKTSAAKMAIQKIMELTQ